jgi:hypothetical protein
MATSLDDLVSVLNQDTARSSTLDAHDAVGALQWSGRVLTYLRTGGLDSELPPRQDDALRRLADACTVAATTFETGPGRISDLTAVTHDAVRSLQGHLTDSDRWAVAIRLATPARRCAAAIATSGPYADVPQLLSVAERSRELLHIAAASPPALAELKGHDLPIPTTMARAAVSPLRTIAETTANLAAQFRLRGRDPMNIRELLAVCTVASRAAAFVDMKDSPTARAGESQAERPSQAWRAARNTVALFADGAQIAHVRTGPSRVLSEAVRVEVAIRRAYETSAEQPSIGNIDAPAAHPDRTDAARIMRFLHQLGSDTEIELGRVRPMLFVPHGPRPLHEGRVAEWLRNRNFAAQPPDLMPAFEVLRRAADRSIDHANALSATARCTALEDGLSRASELQISTVTL